VKSRKVWLPRHGAAAQRVAEYALLLLVVLLGTLASLTIMSGGLAAALARAVGGFLGT
jgi:hypothetical protein